MNPFNYRLVKKMQGLILFALLMVSASLLAQAPQAFKYQAVVRNAFGEPIASTDVSLRISILSGGIEGTEIYRETHQFLTSPGGLVTLDIGTGTPDIGQFDLIPWGLSEYFVKVEVDPAGGTAFVFMGTSQLLSVPYAMYAKEAGGPPSYTWDQLQEYFNNRSTYEPDPGMMIFVSDEGQMVYYNGDQWVTTAGDCFPPPSLADAGEDQVDVEGTSTLLDAILPKFGTGVWSIISEDNGQIVNISDYYDPAALLETTGGNFVLQWTVTNECGETFDQVFISFCPDNTIADAGNDASGIIGNTHQLSGNEPDIGNTGTWSVSSGTGGSFANANDPNTLFTGTPGITYVLRWTIATGCESNYDEVEVNFCFTLTIADAGQDQMNIDGTSTLLEGNQPGAGNSGEWTITSGDGGIIENPAQHNSLFTGMPDETYVLRWTITSDCEESFDEVTINFCPVLTIADAGEDQLDIDGITAQLAANTPGTSNSGFWAIESSFGVMSTTATFDDPEDPTTIFNGEPGVTFVLSWTISTVCDESVDYVTIGFCPELVTADAGPDAMDACIPHNLSANDPGEGNAGEWSVISGTGYSFCDVSNPSAAFSGNPGATYELAWTISNACGSSIDNVTITFDVLPTNANAGPDQLNIEGTSTTLQANTPTAGTGQWTILSGEGGSFLDDIDPGTEFSGQIAETYELEWRISTTCYTSADTMVVSFMAVFVCGDDLVDPRDNQVYPTVQIGTQCWMAKNLNVGVQLITGTNPSDNGIIEKYCYNNIASNCDIYGGLYRWNEAMEYVTTPGTQGVCPQGWHIPTTNEWDILLSFVGSEASCKLREVGSSYWNNNACATNETGFSVRGGGSLPGTMFFGMLSNTSFWTSTGVTTNADTYFFSASSVDVTLLSNPKSYGQYIRCVKDE